MLCVSGNPLANHGFTTLNHKYHLGIESYRLRINHSNAFQAITSINGFPSEASRKGFIITNYRNNDERELCSSLHSQHFKP